MSSMTPEQTIAFLQKELLKMQGKFEKQREKFEKQQKKFAKQKAELDRKQAKIEKLTDVLGSKNQEIEGLTKDRDEYKSICATKDYVIAMQATMLKTVLAKLKEIGADIPEALQDQLKWLLEQSSYDYSIAALNKGGALLKALLATGPESVDKLFKLSRKDNQTAEEQFVQASAQARGIAETENKVANALEVISQEQKKLAAQVQNQANEQLQSAARVADAPVPDNKPDSSKLTNQPQKGKKTAGRRVPEAKVNCTNTYEYPFSADAPCPCCGHKGCVRLIRDNSDFMRVMQSTLSEMLQEGKFTHHVVYCSDCNKVYADRPAQMPVPYSHAAGCQTDSQLVITMGMLQATGMPDHRVETMLGAKRFELATELFARPISAWAGDKGIGGILLSKHEAIAKQAKYIGADETKFPILSQAEEPGSPHLFVRTSVPYVREQFALFSVLKSRSAQAIHEHLVGWQFNHLNCDGYQGYEPALNQLMAEDDRQIEVQNCLTHARRKIVNALASKELRDLIQKDDGLQKVREGILSKSDQYILCTIVEAMRKIYRWESALTPKPDETLEEHRNRVIQTRSSVIKQLMEEIDTQVNALKADHAQEKNGRWITKNGTNTAIAVVYWLNNRSKLGTFLEDPNIAPDSNNVERTIRAAALFKHSAFFKQSMEGAQTFCRLLSLRETANLNGIKDPIKWLIDFHRAFYEHVESFVWTERYHRLAPGTKLALCIPRIPKEAIDSFDFSPWLAWNYAAREAADQ